MDDKLKNLIKFSKNLKVLYIEDSLEAREQTLKLLENFFANIVVAIDGKDGLEKFYRHNIDLIFTDLNMPHIDGISMLKKIRETNSTIPCIVLSAHNEPNYFIETIKLGVDGYILKPIEIDQFSTLLYKIIEKIKLKKDDIDHTRELEQKVKERTKELSKKLYFDDLTELPNRYSLLKRLESCDDNNMPIIFLIDIDSLRTYNELYGIDVGNNIIKQFAKLLLQYCKGSDYDVYRVGGDEFILFEPTRYIDMEKYENTIYEIFNFFSKNRVYIPSLNEYMEISITIGMSFGNNNALAKAYTALFNAKADEKKYKTYNAQIDRTKELKNILYWRKEIKDALLEDRVVPYFQPIVDRGEKIIKYESLIRIKQYDEFGDKKIVTPYNFLEISIHTKQYDDLSFRMINKTMDAMIDKNISFSINLDYRDIYNVDLMNMLKNHIIKFMKNNENSTSRITLEILEGQQIKDYKSFSAKLREVKELGALIAIDDFGSGFSNLTHIVGIAPHFIKIDGELVKNIDTNQNSRKIIRAIVEMAKNLDIRTIAEFVSSKEIFDIVYDLGIDEFQGYYFGKSIPFEDIDFKGGN